MKLVITKKKYYSFLEMPCQEHRSSWESASWQIQQMQALSLELEEFQKDRAKHFENYQRMACRVWDFCREAGLNIYAQEGYRSLSVSCIQNPGEVDVVRELRRRGLILARGYGDLKSTHFRIGHMGRVEISDLEVLLSALKEYLDV